MDTIRSLIDSWAESNPDAVYLIIPETGHELHVRELRELVQNIGLRLHALGVAPGEKISFLLDNGLWSTALFLGAMYSGRVVVPLNALSGPDALAYVLDHSDTKVLFVSQQYREKFGALIDSAAQRLIVILPMQTTARTGRRRMRQPALTRRRFRIPTMSVF